MKLTLSFLKLPLFSAVLTAACATEVATDGSDNPLTAANDGADGGTSGSKDASTHPPPVVIDETDDDDPQAPICGDGVYQEAEACDDGNAAAGDGCAADCSAVELGFGCVEAGEPCVNVDVCGDGRQTAAETCDDGNTLTGDGCTADCQTEEGWACPEPGESCVFTVNCGDGKVGLGEQCDDGNDQASDGCGDSCQVEPGYTCPTAGRRCLAAECGDGIVAGPEECEDGNLTAGDGCDQNCRLELGFVCETSGEKCRAAVCGDGVVEGGEACDDGADTNTGDGCSPGCILEPNCDSGACTSRCGDGLTLSSDDEECDDGNLQPGDGCSPTCQLEQGFKCEQVESVVNGQLELPIVYRDFRGRDEMNIPGVAAAHPDFQVNEVTNDRYGLKQGLVKTALGTAAAGEVVGKPVFSGIATRWVTSNDSFNQWFREVEGVNQTLVSRLVLSELVGQPGSFQFDDDSFFPLDGEGWMSVSDPMGRPYEAARTGGHNFFFTSELTYWFEYKKSGGDWPQLDFRGDDDVWVFINRKLAVDLGGIHEQRFGSVELNPTEAENLGLEVGKVYEIKVFQAERHTTLSSYQLTLSGFTKLTTSCESVCGDGVVTRGEGCDDGENNGAGYGFCGTDCQLGPHCGDGVVDEGVEDCDNGLNLDAYATSATACAPGCTKPAFCGDGSVNTAFGEVCDDGLNDGSYGGCSETCQRGPYCGDGVKQSAEESCDDGNQLNGDKCDFECKIEPPRIAK